MIALGPKPFTGAENKKFQRAWYRQSSTVKMSEDGTRSDCSNAVDATGHYIWRKDGEKDGLCSGIDFEQAHQKRSAGTCGNHPVCPSATDNVYTAFAYDAAMTMGQGLDTLLRQGRSPRNITADALATTMRKLNFSGASGHVAFQNNGDRSEDGLEYEVYNYHAIRKGSDVVGQGFEVVGWMASEEDFKFKRRTCDSCQLIFSDGSVVIPNVQRGVSDAMRCDVMRTSKLT